MLYPYLQMDAVYDNADRASVSYQINELQAVKHVRIQAYYTRVKHWMTDQRRASSVGAPRPYGMATFAATKALGVKVKSEFEHLLLGSESYDRNWNAVNTMRSAGAYADQHSIPNVGVRTAGAFGHYTRTFAERLTLTGGARVDIAAARAHAGPSIANLFWAYKDTRSTSATDTNPSASIQLAYRLPRGFEIFAGLGRTARVPDPQERYFALRRMRMDWVGNPNLRPVRNTEADLGVAFRARRLYIRPTVFYSRLTDFIAAHNAPRLNMAPGVMNSMARSYENVDARMYGGELTYNVGLTNRLLLFGGASYTRGTKQTMPGLRITDTNMAEMPPLKARAALRYGTRLFFAEVEGIAARAQNRVDTDLKESRTAGYGVVNAKVGVHTKRVNIAAGIDNVLNRHFYEAYSYQRDPFRWVLEDPSRAEACTFRRRTVSNIAVGELLHCGYPRTSRRRVRRRCWSRRKCCAGIGRGKLPRRQAASDQRLGPPLGTPKVWRCADRPSASREKSTRIVLEPGGLAPLARLRTWKPLPLLLYCGYGLS